MKIIIQNGCTMLHTHRFCLPQFYILLEFRYFRDQVSSNRRKAKWIRDRSIISPIMLTFDDQFFVHLRVYALCKPKIVLPFLQIKPKTISCSRIVQNKLIYIKSVVRFWLNWFIKANWEIVLNSFSCSKCLIRLQKGFYFAPLCIVFRTF